MLFKIFQESSFWTVIWYNAIVSDLYGEMNDIYEWLCLLTYIDPCFDFILNKNSIDRLINIIGLIKYLGPINEIVYIYFSNNILQIEFFFPK